MVCRVFFRDLASGTEAVEVVRKINGELGDVREVKRPVIRLPCCVRMDSHEGMTGMAMKLRLTIWQLRAVLCL